MNPPVQNQHNFNRGSWVVLLVSLFVVAYAITNVWLAFGQPTDGWYYEIRLDGRWIASASLAGNPTPLQSGDVVLAVEGAPVPPLAARPLPPPSDWQIGSVVRYAVLRAGKSIDLDVPLVARPLSAFWRYYQSQGISYLLVNLLWYLIGFGVFVLRPRDVAARLLLLFTTYWTTLNLVTQADNSATAYYYSPGIFWGYLLLHALWLFMYAIIIHFILAFPVPKWPLTHHPRLTLAFLYGYATIGTGVALGLNRLDIVDIFLGIMVLALVAALLAVTLDNLRRVHHPVARAQISWIALGIGAPILAAMIFFPLQSLIPGFDQGVFTGFANLTSALLPLCFAIAITRFHLFDIYIIIRRTLVYSVLTVLLGLVYFAGVTLLQSLFTGLSGKTSPAALVISTLLIAALFNPLRKRIQDFIDRRFYRQKYNAEQALMRFAASARNETELDLLSNTMVQVANESLHPEFCQVWLVRKEE